MKESAIFRFINRVNSVLFLLLLMGAMGFLGFLSYQSTHWNGGRTVEVKTDKLDDGTPNTQLILGLVRKIVGHNALYVELRSEYKGGKLTGVSGGETRISRCRPKESEVWMKRRFAARVTANLEDCEERLSARISAGGRQINGVPTATASRRAAIV